MLKLITKVMGTAKFLVGSENMFQGTHEINVLLDDENGKFEPGGVVTIAGDELETAKKAIEPEKPITMLLDKALVVGPIKKDNFRVKLIPMKIIQTGGIYRLEFDLFE